MEKEAKHRYCTLAFNLLVCYCFLDSFAHSPHFGTECNWSFLSIKMTVQYSACKRELNTKFERKRFLCKKKKKRNPKRRGPTRCGCFSHRFVQKLLPFSMLYELCSENYSRKFRFNWWRDAPAKQQWTKSEWKRRVLSVPLPMTLCLLRN